MTKGNWAKGIFVGLCVTTAAAQADPGFTHILNPMEHKDFLGAQRQTIRENVFRIIELTPVEIPLDVYAEVLETRVKPENRGHIAYEIAVRELAACRAAGAEKCRLPTLAAAGTAFYARLPSWNSAYLWTVRHNLTTNVKALRTAKVLTEENVAAGRLPLHFLLLNDEGITIFDTRAADSQANIKLLVEPGMKWATDRVRTMNPEEPLDFVLVSLSRELSTAPMLVERNKLGPAEFVYKPGFPDKTETRFSSYRLNDSDGRSLYLSTGWTTSPSHAWAYASGELIEVELEDVLREYYFNFGTEGIVGYSGAPVLDRNGLVIGLYMGSMGANLERVYKDFASIGLHSNWILSLARASGLEF